MENAMKKIISFIMAIALAMCAFSLVACDNQSSQPIVIWTFTDELGKMIENYYKKNVDADANIEIKTMGVNDLSTKLDSALRAKKNLPDIVAIEEKYISKYADSGAFMSLQDMVTGDNQMYTYALDAARDKSGNVMAFAWQATPGALYYRTDMAKEILGVNNPEEMQNMVDTWEKFMSVAQTLKNYNGAKFSDVRILSDVAAPARAFYSERNASWIVDGKLSIETQLYKGETSLYEIIKTLQVGNGVWGQSEDPFINETTERTTAWFNDMSQDKVFSYLLPSYSLQYDFKKYAKNATAGTDTTGKWAICQGPAVYSDGGTWLGILNSSANAEKAKEIIRYFTMDEGFLRAWANDTGDFMNNKALMTEFANDANRAEAFLGGQNHYALFNEIANKIKGNNRTAYDSKINSMFSEWAINYAKVENVSLSSAKLDALNGFVEGVAGAYSSVIDTDNMTFDLD